MEFAMPTEIDGKVIAIGDLHGHLADVKRLWENLESTVEDLDAYWIVFLGDYCDRGPDTKGLLDWMIELHTARGRVIALLGNHDHAMAGFLGLLPYPKEKHDFRCTHSPDVLSDERCELLWRGEGFESVHMQGLRWGGGSIGSVYESNSTFRSYGVSMGDREGLIEAVPENHKAFLRAMPWVVEHPSYIFVHAGLERSISVSSQLASLKARDTSIPRLQTLSCRFLTSVVPEELKTTGRAVVSGHVNLYGHVSISPHRILLDTTGGHGGSLAAIALPEVWRADREKGNPLHIVRS